MADAMDTALETLKRDATAALKRCENDDQILFVASSAFEIGRAIAMNQMGPAAAAQWMRRIADLMDRSVQ